MGIYRRQLEDLLTIPARIVVPASESASAMLFGRTIPRPVDVTLILDTGTRRSCVTQRVLNTLHRPSAGSMEVQTAAGVTVNDFSVVDIEFPEASLSTIPDTIVVALSMPPKLSHYDGVIGRDILKRWEFFYSGFRNRLTIRDYRSIWGWLCA